MTDDASLRGRLGAHVKWAGTVDRTAATAPARAGFMARFEREVDPDGVLPEATRRVMAEHAMRAYMTRISRESAKARRKTGKAAPTAKPQRPAVQEPAGDKPATPRARKLEREVSILAGRLEAMYAMSLRETTALKKRLDAAEAEIRRLREQRRR